MDLRLTEIMCCPRCGPPHRLVLLADRVEQQRVYEGVLGCPNCGARYPVRGGYADLRPPEERNEELTAAEGEAEWAGPVGARAETSPERGRSDASPPAPPPGAAAGQRQLSTPPAAPHAPVAAPPPAAPPAAVPPGPTDEQDQSSSPAPPPEEAATRVAALIGMEHGLGPRYALVIGPDARLAPGMAALVPESEVVAAGPGLGAWPEAAGVSRIALGRKLPFLEGSVRGVALSGPAADGLLEEGVRVLDPMGRLLLEPVPATAPERLAGVGARAVAREGDRLVAVRVRVG